MELRNFPCPHCRRLVVGGLCACLFASNVAAADIPHIDPMEAPQQFSSSLLISSVSTAATKFASAKLQGAGAFIANAFVVHPPSTSVPPSS